MLLAFIHGTILALGLILPLGVQNIFIFTQGAQQKSLTFALPAVVAASLCDTILISFAVLGVSTIVLELAWLKSILILTGVFFLLYVGWILWVTKKGTTKRNSIVMTPKQQIAFAISVSLLNPHAIIDTIGVIGTSSIAYSGLQKWMFSIACILISWLWFFGLAIVGRLVRQADEHGIWIQRINRVSALLIWGTAIYLLITSV